MSTNVMQNKKDSTKGFPLGTVLNYVYLILGSLFIFFPFFIAVSISLAPEYSYQTDANFNVFAHSLTMANYIKLFKQYELVKGFLNTIIYIVPPVFGGVFCSAMAAYAFARINFPGKNVVFFALISTIVIPGIITLVPSYTMFVSVYQWADTPWPLIIPGMFGAPMTMFFIKQFYDGFPKELEEAAFIDGQSRLGVFMDIAFPLAKPVIITQIILSLNGAYNDYLGPLLYLNSAPDMKTLQLMLRSILTPRSQPYGLMLAGAVISLIPTFAMFLGAQKFFVDGIVFTGIKG